MTHDFSEATLLAPGILVMPDGELQIEVEEFWAEMRRDGYDAPEGGTHDDALEAIVAIVSALAKPLGYPEAGCVDVRLCAACGRWHVRYYAPASPEPREAS
jgi:hypothetical protein